MEKGQIIFEITEKDNIANQAPFDFDVSVKDIFSGIFTGATVHLVPKMFFSFPTKERKSCLTVRRISL